MGKHRTMRMTFGLAPCHCLTIKMSISLSQLSLHSQSGISINSFSNPFTSPFSSTPTNKSEVDSEIDPSEVSTIQTPSLISSTTSSNLMSSISSSLPAFSSLSYYSGYTPYSSYNYQFQSPISLDEVSKDLQERASTAAEYLNLSKSRSTSVASEGRVLKSRRGVRTVGFFLV